MQSVAEVAFNSGPKPGPSQEGGKELGVVAGIFIGAAPGEPMHSVAEIKAIAGEGLEGDRKRLRGVPRKQVTLIEREALEAAARDYGIGIMENEPRRNLLTRDVALNHLVGREFIVGEVRLRGLELCDPYSHLERLTGKKMIQALQHPRQAARGNP